MKIVCSDKTESTSMKRNISNNKLNYANESTRKKCSISTNYK